MRTTTRAASAVRFILALTALLLPSLSLLPLGGLYLWEKGWLLWWALGALASVGIVVALQRWLLFPQVAPEASSAAALDNDADQSADTPAANWSPIERRAWDDVLAIAKRVEPDKLGDFQAVLGLGQTTIETVARRLHPGKQDAIWHFTMPEALAISERVSQQLRLYVQDNVPFGDRLTVAQVLSVYRWRGAIDVAEKAYDIWRLVRLVNPVTAATNEARERLSKALLGWGREHVTRRLAEHYVEEVGRAAIDLYGGRLRIQLDGVDASAASPSVPGAETAALPLKVLIVGGRAEQRGALARLIASGEREALEHWLAAPQAAPARSAPVAIATSLTSVTDGTTGEVDAIVAEARAADIIVLVAGASGLTDADRAVLSAISRHFTQREDLLCPCLLPVVVATAVSDNAARDLDAELSASFAGALMPSVRGVEAGHADVVWRALEQAAPRARRVAAVRRIAEAKQGRGWLDAGRQATSAAGSLARALLRRRQQPTD
jgi:hypothetical protein